MAGKKVVFLDRDGTINVDYSYVYKQEDWEFTDRAVEGLRLLQEAGFTLAVITNQSGIAREYYTEAQMHALHTYMQELLVAEGVRLAAVAFCPHGRESTCECRKPNPGMARMIEKEVGEIDYAASWTIGDKEADVQFGAALGTHTALVRSEYWREGELLVQPELVVDSLFTFARSVVA